MDEPFGALDPIIRGKAQDDLLDIQRRFGTTIILVTHDMDEAFKLGHRVAVMSEGRLLQHGRPTELVTHPADPFVSQLVGAGDRSLRLLSLIRADEAVQPGTVDGPVVTAATSLREVLAELVWQGATGATVHDTGGRAIGHVSLGAILVLGRHAE
jgi:osmoprotectant transport system ATP-binding protein